MGISDHTPSMKPDAKEVQKANEFMENIPDMNEEKVYDLQTQVQNGTYEVKTEKVAQKMIKESLYNQYL